VKRLIAIACLALSCAHVEFTKGADLLMPEEVALEVSARLDVQELVDRAEVLPGGANVDASVRIDKLGGSRFSLQLDASGFGGASVLQLGGGAPVLFTPRPARRSLSRGGRASCPSSSARAWPVCGFSGLSLRQRSSERRPRSR